MRHLIKNLLREGLLKEDYFNWELPTRVKKLSTRVELKQVTWYGNPEQMIILRADEVHGMWGNIYDNNKLDYVVNMIKSGDEDRKPEFECSYGMGNVISIIDIEEEQRAFHGGHFESEYEKDRPASTGDEELDEYIGTEEITDLDFVSDNVSNPDIIKFFDKHKLSIVFGEATPDELMERLGLLNPDEEELEAIEEFIRLGVEIKKAMDTNQGDFNKFMVQLRDGHHRVMGAIKAGETHVCVNLAKDDIEHFKGYYKKA